MQLGSCVISAVVLHMFVIATYGQDSCSIPLPSDNELANTLLAPLYANQIGEGGVSVNLMQFAYTCQAVSSRDMYRSLSVVVMFTANNSPSVQRFGQFQLNCENGDWSARALNLNLDASIFSIPLRINCSSCSDSAGNEANCVACDSSCEGIGQGACTGPDSSDCCPYFNRTTGECITSCVVPDPATFECVCDIRCSASFGSLNATSCQCICSEGYTGDDCSIDINECDNSPCQNGATCIDQVAGYSCICSAGFTGENCDTDIDECSSNPCQNNATCIDEIAGYSCICSAGFTGENCDTDIDECSNNPCQNDATCINEIAGYNCICSAGFTGENCDINIDDCSNNPCQNGATCNDGIAGYNCICSAGFTGENCEVDINECDNNPCQNGATCIDEVARYTCICSAGFTGENCDIDINECNDNPCQNGGTCINQSPFYICECAEFFTGANCESPLIFERCNAVCLDPDVFNRDLCKFYCKLREWREIAIQSGIDLPEVRENMDSASSNEDLWREALSQQETFSELWSTFSSSQGLIIDDGSDNTQDSASLVIKWESQFSETRRDHQMWREYAENIEPGLNFETLESYSVNEDSSPEDLSAIYNTYCEKWSDDVNTYVTNFGDNN